MDWMDKKLTYFNVSKFPWTKKKLPKSRSNTNIPHGTCPDVRCSCKKILNNISESEELAIEEEEKQTEEVALDEDDEEEVEMEVGLSDSDEEQDSEKELGYDNMSLTALAGDIESCTCEDCVKEEPETPGFETHEISSFRLVVLGPDILTCKGTTYLPQDLAPYWKKDSRMWLWKSVRLAERHKNISKSLSRIPSLSS